MMQPWANQAICGVNILPYACINMQQNNDQTIHFSSTAELIIRKSREMINASFFFPNSPSHAPIKTARVMSGHVMPSDFSSRLFARLLVLLSQSSYS